MAPSSILESLFAVAVALILAALVSTNNTVAVSAARPLDHQKQPMVRLAPLEAGLYGMDEDNSSSTTTSTTWSDCWESLFQLQACTGEVILFFLDGETYLGQECCHAIHVIEVQCWPSMLTSLGYTAEETDILRGYCDTADAVPPPPEMEIHSAQPTVALNPDLVGISPKAG